MTSVSSFRLLVALVFILIALFTVLQDRPAASLPDPATLERQRKRILYQGRSEAYQDIINPITDPILLVRNAKVAAANPAAAKVLGDHIVGADRSSRYAAERMRTDFVANASHELRTPLAAIKGFLETLEDPKAGKDDATRARFLKIMYNEADRMQRLVEDLMSLSRIEAEKFEIPSEQIDLSELVGEARDFYINSRGKKENEILVKAPADIPLIYGDRAQLSQVVNNLLSNAFKYGKKGAPVTISLAPNRSGTMLCLAISDQGDGIAAEHIPRLTERFYRVDKGRSKSIGGTGLGLAIVKHITERHGGRMEISSTVGQGTTVSIILPIASNSLTQGDPGHAVA